MLPVGGVSTVWLSKLVGRLEIACPIGACGGGAVQHGFEQFDLIARLLVARQFFDRLPIALERTLIEQAECGLLLVNLGIKISVVDVDIAIYWLATDRTCQGSVNRAFSALG
jgi:hypothetical protein